MTNKELLLVDLCGRIPYHVKGKVYDEICTLNSITPCGRLSFVGINSSTIYEIHEFKPYLFPMSAMTEEQVNEYKRIVHNEFIDYMLVDINVFYKGNDYLNEHHFDYRGLIQKGLALDATNFNIYESNKRNVH